HRSAGRATTRRPLIAEAAQNTRRPARGRRGRQIWDTEASRSVDAVDGGSGVAAAYRQHHDLRTDVSPVIEIDHILVEQADAARGHEAADGFGRVGAVNAIDGVAEIHRARAEGIARAARHEARQIGLALDHLRGRRPVRPLGLALDRLHAGPSEAFTTHANAVPHRLAAGEYQVKVRVRRVDDDSAGRLAGTV